MATSIVWTNWKKLRGLSVLTVLITAGPGFAMVVSS
jgi:hypothetical protein